MQQSSHRTCLSDPMMLPSGARSCMCRHGFRHVVEINQRLIGMLMRSGADKAVDMDEQLKREALDVIGWHRNCCSALSPPLVSPLLEVTSFFWCVQVRPPWCRWTISMYVITIADCVCQQLKGYVASRADRFWIRHGGCGRG